MDRVTFRTLLRSAVCCPAMRSSLLLLLVLSTVTNLAQVDGGGIRRPIEWPNLDAFSEHCGKTPLFNWSNAAENAYRCPGNRDYHRHHRGQLADGGKSGLKQHRIAGGYFAEEGQFPSYVQLIISSENNTSLCGGTLIDANMVMTATHCVPEGTTQILARAGFVDARNTEFMQQRMALGSCKLPGYVQTLLEGYFNDITLVLLVERFNYTTHVQPACLALDQPHKGRAQCFAVGMGSINNAGDVSNRLMVLPVERNTCIAPLSNETLIESTSRSCYKASHKEYPGNTCQGDSGGAVYCIKQCTGKSQQVAVAVTSYVLRNNCAPDYPWQNGFADVYKVRDNLVDVINSCKVPELIFSAH